MLILSTTNDGWKINIGISNLALIDLCQPENLANTPTCQLAQFSKLHRMLDAISALFNLIE